MEGRVLFVMVFLGRDNDLDYVPKQDFETLSDFRYQLRRFLHWSEQLTRKAGITNLQYLLMLHVKGYANREWATITELAERLQAQHHGVVALVPRCEKLGLVERTPHPTDGRQIIVTLSDAGTDLLADEAQAREVWLTERLENLASASLATLREAVGILTALVAEDD